MSYLHRPKDEHLIGSYHMFWSRRIAEVATDSDVAVLLDSLIAREPSVLDDRVDIRPRHFVGTLLVRGIQAHGESISDERLCLWLGVVLDNHGFSRIRGEEAAAIKAWLEAHPERYKGAVSASIAMRARRQLSVVPA